MFLRVCESPRQSCHSEFKVRGARRQALLYQNFRHKISPVHVDWQEPQPIKREEKGSLEKKHYSD